MKTPIRKFQEALKEAKKQLDDCLISDLEYANLLQLARQRYYTQERRLKQHI